VSDLPSVSLTVAEASVAPLGIFRWILKVRRLTQLLALGSERAPVATTTVVVVVSTVVVVVVVTVGTVSASVVVGGAGSIVAGRAGYSETSAGARRRQASRASASSRWPTTWMQTWSAPASKCSATRAAIRSSSP
jgi:hypothetical protein